MKVHGAFGVWGFLQGFFGSLIGLFVYFGAATGIGKLEHIEHINIGAFFLSGRLNVQKTCLMQTRNKIEFKSET